MKPSTRAIIGAGLSLMFTAATRAQSNWAVAPDNRGALYFCDIQRDKVWLWEPRGLRLLFDHNHCHTLVLGYDGWVYGENVGGESRAGGVVGVWRLAPEGQREFLLAPTARPDPSIWVVRDAKGNTYAWEGNPETKGRSRILERSPQGELRVLAGDLWGFADGAGNTAKFGQVAAMAATADGSLYLADDQSVVYVVDYGRNHILRWDAAHGTRVVFQSRGVANWLSSGGWGWRPTGVAVEKNSILVMEDWGLPTFAAELIGNPRVSRVLADGTVVKVTAVSNTVTRIFAAAILLVLGLAMFAWRRNKTRRSSTFGGKAKGEQA